MAFHAITRQAVQKGLQQKRKIDQKLVKAAVARRVDMSKAFAQHGCVYIPRKAITYDELHALIDPPEASEQPEKKAIEADPSQYDRAKLWANSRYHSTTGFEAIRFLVETFDTHWILFWPMWLKSC